MFLILAVASLLLSQRQKLKPQNDGKENASWGHSGGCGTGLALQCCYFIFIQLMLMWLENNICLEEAALVFIYKYSEYQM